MVRNFGARFESLKLCVVQVLNLAFKDGLIALQLVRNVSLHSVKRLYHILVRIKNHIMVFLELRYEVLPAFDLLIVHSFEFG